ncbi:MAG TPA: hypothetical protein VIH72_05720 [Candidatus Acidoferrales bacterium]|jgi:hypothetical protein
MTLHRWTLIAFVALSISLPQHDSKSKALPSGVLAALARDEKDYCDQFSGSFRNGCQRTFRESLSWREVVITPSGRKAVLVENGKVCGSGGCTVYLFVEQPDAKFLQVLGTQGEVGEPDNVSILASVVKGYFNIQKTWRDGKTQTLYVWNGKRYAAL